MNISVNSNEMVNQDQKFTISDFSGLPHSSEKHEEKLQKALDYLKDKWILHPNNKIQKKQNVISVLGR